VGIGIFVEAGKIGVEDGLEETGLELDAEGIPSRLESFVLDKELHGVLI